MCTFRMQLAQFRTTEADVDPYTHNLPETRNTTPPVCNNIAGPAFTYETAKEPLSTHPPESHFETRKM